MERPEDGGSHTLPTEPNPGGKVYRDLPKKRLLDQTIFVNEVHNCVILIHFQAFRN